MHAKHIIALLLALVIYGCSGQQRRLYDLRCEGLETPLGIDNTEPHFSWKLQTANAERQVS